jgi:hypothetical protein
MLNIRLMPESLGKPFRLVLLVMAGLVSNGLIVSSSGIALAYLAMYMANNASTFQQNYFYIFLIMVLMVAIIALPGFFLVQFLSKLSERNRKLGALIAACTGTLIYIPFATMTFVRMSDKWPAWLILAGLIGNVIGQWLAVALIARSQNDQ